MNPLGNGNLNNIPPAMMQNIQQLKGIMHACNGNLDMAARQLSQNNPMVNQVLQMYKGQNLQSIFMTECRRQGVDPNAILNELRRY